MTTYGQQKLYKKLRKNSKTTGKRLVKNKEKLRATCNKDWTQPKDNLNVWVEQF